jgi:hypothetical protein
MGQDVGVQASELEVFSIHPRSLRIVFTVQCMCGCKESSESRAVGLRMKAIQP